jgi:UMF1 family MFS transporter
MYDWANSAYAVTVLSGLLGPYLVSVVAPDGVTFMGRAVPTASLYTFTAAFSAVTIFLTAPILGAIADFAAARKGFLLFFAYTGSLATIPLFFSGAGRLYLTLFLFLIAQTSFVAANVFYNALLPAVASQDKLDRVSARGYAFGYFGGSLQFALSLALISFNDLLGIDTETAARVAMTFAGIWWAGFTLFTLKLVREDGAGLALPERFRNLPRATAYVRIGFRRTWETTAKVRKLKPLLLFLLAFMFYNDGIQTVIIVGTTFGREELGLSDTALMATLLCSQIIAMPGALIFSRIAGAFGTKNAILLSVAIWAAVVIYAYSIETATQFFVMGSMIGIVLGGSQALSRSLYGSMIPPGASAEFYGFYSVFEKFSAILGPFAFGLSGILFGSLRAAILSLILFFVVGFVLLFLVDVEKARGAVRTEEYWRSSR